MVGVDVGAEPLGAALGVDDPLRAAVVVEPLGAAVEVVPAVETTSRTHDPRDDSVVVSTCGSSSPVLSSRPMQMAFPALSEHSNGPTSIFLVALGCEKAYEM